MRSLDDLVVLNPDDVDRLLPMRDCIELMTRTLAALPRGQDVLPLRTVIALPDGRGSLYTMPAYAAESRALAVKLVTLFPGNEVGPLPTHQGVLLLFSADDGRPIALIDAARVTAIRTAAVSAVATRALARPDAGDLAILGSGVQAATHLEAISLVRSIRRVRVWSRTREHAAAFAEQASVRAGIAVEAVDTARDAVHGADIICTVTSAHQPVLCGEWLAPGAHINAVGASTAASRELDTAVVVRARIWVDRLEAAFAEAGDVLIPIEEGAITRDHVIGELGQLLAGDVPGRTDASQITLFKSLGLAVEDAAAARALYDRALSRRSD